MELATEDRSDTTRAGALIALHIKHDILPRQMVGKRKTPWRGPGLGFLIVGRRHRLMSFRAGDVGTEVLDPEGQLIGIEPLGAASEPGSLKFFDDALKTSDLVITGLDDDGHIAHQEVQKADIGRQVLKIETHERFYSIHTSRPTYLSDFTHVFVIRSAASAGHGGPPNPFGRAPVDTLDQHRQLFGCQRQRIARLARTGPPDRAEGM